ncbi:InlB B-repeat-containing protein [Cohnella sp. GCM10020058]|uniref:InlB B-repeat-containing protein n=1 Tax=Cohnella sp. GCM10020058 TaxID=3317330 RepID=UPI0036414EAA
MVKRNKIMMVVLALAVFVIVYSGIAKAQGTATLKVSPSASTSTVGEEVTFTVTALDPVIGGTTPGGTVTFKDGNQDLLTAELSTAVPVITTRAGCSFDCPMIQWGVYTIRANSYENNRIALNIKTYDASGTVVQDLEKAGARYLSRIEMDAAARTFTFWGQDDKTITMGWDEFLSASSSAGLKTSDLAVGTHTITAAFPGDAAHAASEASITYIVHPRYTVTYNGNGSTGGDVPANSSSYSGTKASIHDNDGHLAKTGYAFAGWNTQANGQGTYYAADAEGTITSDVTLYALWTKVLDVGTGTESDPYRISTSEELDTVRNYLNPDLYFKLTADIDLSSYGQSWVPIGGSGQPFHGHMDGNGHKITGLTVNRPDTNYAGLFGYIYYEASITNVILDNVNVTGRQYVGGLIGYNYGTVSNSYVSGSVTGKSTYAGGLIGYNYYGTVSSSFSTASVTGAGNNVGGLTGGNTGEISFSYATGNVTGTGTNVGGLVGNNGGEISNGYATGSVTGTGAKLGGLVGNNGGVISAGFYDSDTTGQSDTGKGVGQTTIMMKTQSTFAGWDFASAWGISPSRNNGYPYLQAIQKFVTYDGNGNAGGSVPTDLTSYAPGAQVDVNNQAVTLVKAHYTFAGWNTAANGSGTDYAPGAAFSMGASDVTLYAKWMPNPTYTVTYDGNGSTGGSVPTDSGSYEQSVAASVYGNDGNLVKVHYTFAGWNTAADGHGTDYAAGATFSMGSSNVTLYAQWTLNPTYTVTYVGNGSTGGSVPTDSGSYEENAAVTVAGNGGSLVKAHYTFAGWNTAANGSGTDYAAGATFSMGASAVTLYAKWVPNPTYTVTYDGNGSTGGSAPTDNGSYEEGAAVTVAGNGGSLVKAHYTFAGWNTAANGSGTDYAAGATFSMGPSNVILYAKWMPIPTYTVTYDGNGSTGGSAPTDSGSYEEGAAVTVAGNGGNLVKTGYTFGGWNIAADGSGTGYAGGKSFPIGTQNVTLYAQWLSTIALLSGLSADQGSIHFLPSQTNYAVEVDNSVSSLNLFLSKGDPAQSLTVAGATYLSVTDSVYAYNAASLVVGPNPIRITVTAQDGSSTAYVVTVTRKYAIGEPVRLDPSVRELAYSGGLTIKLPDGLAIPEGATLTVKDSTVAPSGEVKLDKAGQVIDFKFEGMTINQPVTITLGYDTGSNRNQIAIYYYNLSTGKWEYQPSRVTDNGIETTVGHFSTYGVLADIAAPDRVTIASGAKTANSITVHLDAHDDSGIAKYMVYRDGTLIAETAESTYVDTGLSSSKTYTYTAKAVDMLGNISNVSDSITVATNDNSAGGPYTPVQTTSDPKVTSADGRLTLPAGRAGEVSLGDAIKIVIPANAAGKELKLTIDKVSDVQTLITSKDILLSPVFEIVKNFAENFDKPVAISFKFDVNSLKGNEKPVVFYYDEAKKEWVKVGGIVNGNNIAVEVNHFTKYAVLAVAEAAPPATEASFSDIAAHWAEASIKKAASAGIVSGYADGTFKPGRSVTRAEFAVMLMNALKPQGDGTALTFADKAKIGSWAQKSVAQAVYAGIINGYEDGTFRPNAEITRAEMASMIAKVLRQTGESVAATGFADDKDIPDWAKGAVAAMKKLGIIEGKGANRFAPGDKATRAEAVTVLLKMLEQRSE